MTAPRTRLSSLATWVAHHEALAFCALASLIAASLLLRPAPAAVPAGKPVDDFASRLEADIPRWMARYEIPGVSVALVLGGEPSWSAVFGHADRDSHRPFTRETPLMAHSISKSLTAWGVMRLVEEGRIDLDAPVGRYLEDWSVPAGAYPSDEVTVRRLLSHTAGLSLGSFGLHYAPGETVPDLPAYLRAEGISLVRPPGSGFEYSNTGFAVLELVVEAASERPFAEYMADEILVPLGMRRSSFEPSSALLSRVATGYDQQGTPVPVYRYPFHASGGLFTTIDDVTRFVVRSLRVHAGAQQAPLAPASVREMYTPQASVGGLFSWVTDAYGLGHFVETLDGARVAAWHGGQGLGWMTHFHLVPETQDGIVVFTNSQRSWPFFARVLGSWSRWRGLGTVGMARLARVQDVAHVLIGWILLGVVWMVARVAVGIWARRRRMRLRGAASPVLRGLQLGLGSVILISLAWAAAQDYLFVSSVLPAGWPWLFGSALALGMVCLLAAALPVVREARGDAAP